MRSWHEEKAFLQGIAGLVQQHAETVKSMAKQARAAKPAPAKEPAPPPVVEPEVVEVEAVEPEVVEPEVDRTQALPVEEPIRVDEPLPASTKAGDRDAPAGDPSLKELFWGEES